VSWIDKLEAHGSQAVKAKHKPAPATPAVICYVTVEVRQPSGNNDPGEVAEGYYTLSDNLVTLTHVDGRPIDGVMPQHLQDGEYAKKIARRMISDRWSKRRANSFRGPLRYPPMLRLV
jgi:hypothetical protein